MTRRSYPQPFPAMLRKGCGKMAMDNSSARTTEEESEHPPLSSCSQKTLIKNRKSGQLICYKTGQVYLLLTVIHNGNSLLHNWCKTTPVKQGHEIGLNVRLVFVVFTLCHWLLAMYYDAEEVIG